MENDGDNDDNDNDDENVMWKKWNEVTAAERAAEGFPLHNWKKDTQNRTKHKKTNINEWDSAWQVYVSILNTIFAIEWHLKRVHRRKVHTSTLRM